MPRIKGKGLGVFLAQVIGVLSAELGLGFCVWDKERCSRLIVFLG